MSEIKCRRCGQFIEKRRDGIWVTSEWPIGLPYCGSVPHPPHESAEPSPAPPTERVIEVAPQEEIPTAFDQSRGWEAIIKWAYANNDDGVLAVRDIAREFVDWRARAQTAESALTAARAERDIRHTAIQQPLMDKIQEMSKELIGLRGERDQLKSHYSDAKELIQRMMKEEEALREERDRAQDALRAIESLCSDEITARFGGHAHKSEDELGRNSRVYALLVVPRNIARAALKPVSDRQPEGEKP